MGRAEGRGQREAGRGKRDEGRGATSRLPPPPCPPATSHSPPPGRSGAVGAWLCGRAGAGRRAAHVCGIRSATSLQSRTLDIFPTPTCSSDPRSPQLRSPPELDTRHPPSTYALLSPHVLHTPLTSSKLDTGHLSSRLSRMVTTYCSGRRWSCGTTSSTNGWCIHYDQSGRSVWRPTTSFTPGGVGTAVRQAVQGMVSLSISLEANHWISFTPEDTLEVSVHTFKLPPSLSPPARPSTTQLPPTPLTSCPT